MLESNSQAVSNSNTAPALSTLALSNKATVAAVTYLTTPEIPHGISSPGNKITCKHCDAFDHLVAICWRAKGNLYVAPRKEDKELGIGLVEATRHWIQEWLVEFLAPYGKQAVSEIVAAANRGEFRYVGRKCKLALIDYLRNKGREPKAVIFSLDKPLAVDEYGGEFTLQDSTETATEPGVAYQSALGRRHVDPAEVMAIVQLRRDELRKLLGQRLLEILEIVIAAFPENLDRADLVERIATRQGIGTRQAQASKRQLAKIMNEARVAGNRAADHLYRFLEPNRKVSPDRLDRGNAPKEYRPRTWPRASTFED